MKVAIEAETNKKDLLQEILFSCITNGNSDQDPEYVTSLSS